MIRQCNISGTAVPEGALDLPNGLNIAGMKNWTNFGIWGLLFYDDQPPWFVLIECMHILFHLNGESSSNALFHPPESSEGVLSGVDANAPVKHEMVKYSVPRNSILRHLLFRDTEITDPAVGDNWNIVESRTQDRYPNWTHSLSHLRNTFVDVASLRRALKLLRTAEVETGSAKRWTSKHLLPLGPNMLFADVNSAKQGGGADRRFMRRTGELLYLMLGRSEHGLRQRLSDLLRKRLLDNATPWDHMAALIGNPKLPGSSAHADSVSLATGYLPYLHLDRYDRLADDWISLLSLSRVQIEHLMDPLMRVSALHLIIYMVQRAQATQELHPDRFPPFVFDLAVSSRRSVVQRMAAAQYDNHVKLPRRAIDAYLDAFGESEDWSSSSISVEKCRKLLRTRFLWSDSSSSGTSEQLLDELRSDCLKSTSHTIWATIANLARGSGMTIARGGVGTWYAPDDAFLEALVLANVQGPMELGQFLRRLYEQYRIVIGQRQALDGFGGDLGSYERFKENERRFEDRLRVLGFIDRKSDACAFVVNPFYWEMS